MHYCNDVWKCKPVSVKIVSVFLRLQHYFHAIPDSEGVFRFIKSYGESSPLPQLTIRKSSSFFNNRMGTGESQEWGLSGRVQCVGLMSWVNTRPLICLASPARSADARQARFSGELASKSVASLFLRMCGVLCNC